MWISGQVQAECRSHYQIFEFSLPIIFLTTRTSNFHYQSLFSLPGLRNFNANPFSHYQVFEFSLPITFLTTRSCLLSAPARLTSRNDLEPGVAKLLGVCSPVDDTQGADRVSHHSCPVCPVQSRDVRGSSIKHRDLTATLGRGYLPKAACGLALPSGLSGPGRAGETRAICVTVYCVRFPDSARPGLEATPPPPEISVGRRYFLATTIGASSAAPISQAAIASAPAREEAGMDRDS